MKSKTSYVLPDTLVKGEAKLKSGDEMVPRMIGAYYGSSYEYNVSVKIQYASGGNVECPAEETLKTMLKPKYGHGEFGAFLVDEATDVTPSKDLGRSVVELATEEEVRAVRKSVDRLMELNDLTEGLRYRDKSGHELSYFQLSICQANYRNDNKIIQEEKNRYLEEQHLLPTYIGGKKVNPSYPQTALDKLNELNKKVWTATGVNLVITFTGLHTIAKDSKFYTGQLDQAGLDKLAAKLDYKEVESFHKGVIKSGRVSVPIQTVSQLKKAFNWLDSINGEFIKEWPESVKKSLIHLKRERAST